MAHFSIAKRLLIVAACLHSLSVSAQDQAPPPKVKLIWPAEMPTDFTCLTTIAMKDAVLRKFDRDVFEDNEAGAAVIEGRVESVDEPGSLRISLEMREPGGEVAGRRTLEPLSGDCVELLDAVSLVVALMIDPDLPLKEKPLLLKEDLQKEKTPIPVHVKKAVLPSVKESPVRDSQKTTKRENRIRPSVSFSAVLMPNVLPEALPGLGGEIGMRYKDAWQLSFCGSAIFHQATEIAGGEVGFSFAHFGLKLRATLFSKGRFAMDAVAGIRAGVLSFQGKGFSVQNFDDTAWTLDGDAGLGFSVRISKHWMLVFDTTADFFFIRREVIVKDEQENSVTAHQIPLAVFRGSLSVVILF